jgi:hypothetical protein
MVQLVAMTAVLARDYALDVPALETVEPSCSGLLTPTSLPGRWTEARTSPHGDRSTIR